VERLRLQFTHAPVLYNKQGYALEIVDKKTMQQLQQVKIDSASALSVLRTKGANDSAV
jgi:hypothetical protein